MAENGPLKISKDHQRFRQIVKGRIRKDLRKFLTRGELLGKEGKHLVSIPVPGIDLPHFRYGDNNDQGVGQGEGEAGQQVDGDAEGIGPGGTEPGAHILEVEVSLEELADILGEELQLPRIEPKATTTSPPSKSVTAASASPDPNRCGTSSARSAGRCGG